MTSSWLISFSRDDISGFLDENENKTSTKTSFVQFLFKAKRRKRLAWKIHSKGPGLISRLQEFLVSVRKQDGRDYLFAMYFVFQSLYWNGVSDSVYFVLSKSNFLTFLKLTLKFDPSVRHWWYIVNESFSCLYVVTLVYPKLCNKQIIKC